MEQSLHSVIEPGHSGAGLDADIPTLATEIAAKLPQADVRAVPKERLRYGLTWWEVIRIYILDPADQVIVGVILAEAIRWCRERFKKMPKRLKSITILGPDGKVIKSVLIKNPTDEPEDRTVEDNQEPTRPPPSE